MNLVKYYYTLNKKYVYSTLILLLLMVSSIISYKFVLDKIVELNVVDYNGILLTIYIQLSKLLETLPAILFFIIFVSSFLSVVLNNIGRKRKFLLKNYGKVASAKYFFLNLLIMDIIIVISFLIVAVMTFIPESGLASMEEITLLYKIMFSTLVYSSLYMVSGLNVLIMVIFSIKEKLFNSNLKYSKKKTRILKIFLEILRYVIIGALLFGIFILANLTGLGYSEVYFLFSTPIPSNIEITILILVGIQAMVVVDYLRKYLNEIYV